LVENRDFQNTVLVLPIQLKEIPLESYVMFGLRTLEQWECQVVKRFDIFSRFFTVYARV